MKNKKIALIEPAIEKLANQVGNKYILCNVVSKRAKEILKERNDPAYDQKDDGIKEISEAAIELEDNKLLVEVLPKTLDDDIEQ